MKFTRARTAIAAFLALLQPALPQAAIARSTRAAHAAHPALWQVKGPAGTVWLFGTIHALPPHFEWENPIVQTAVNGSDRLVIEALIDHDAAKSAAALIRLGTAHTPLPPIVDRVAPKYHDAMQAMIAKTSVPASALDGMKTWAAAMVLFGVTVNGLGVSSADGVEEQLKGQFAAAGKPIEGLETVDQQLGFFDTLTEAQQRDFLESVVDQKSDDASDFGKMLGAWSHGNEKGIQSSFDRDMKGSDVLRDVLLNRRNAHWADAIVGRLAMPGTQFIAVGAGHLVGPDSVQARLAQLGYKSVRIQ